MNKTRVLLLALCSASALAPLLPAPARAELVVLDFDDIVIPGGTELVFFTPYQEDGFTITATNPPTGFSSGLVAFGENSIFFAGSQALATFAPASPPANVIELTNDAGLPFDLLSIDLARLFRFDAAPTVTFIGSLLGGGEVTQSFTVTTPVGVPGFQTFSFTGFENLVSVRWGQPVAAEGNHQFDNIRLEVIPEPSTACLLAIGGAAIGAARFVRRRRSASS